MRERRLPIVLDGVRLDDETSNKLYELAERDGVSVQEAWRRILRKAHTEAFATN